MVPKYDSKPGAELGWFGFGAACGGLIAAIVLTLDQLTGVDLSMLATALGVFTTAGTRLALSLVLPRPQG